MSGGGRAAEAAEAAGEAQNEGAAAEKPRRQSRPPLPKGGSGQLSRTSSQQSRGLARTSSTRSSNSSAGSRANIPMMPDGERSSGYGSKKAGDRLRHALHAGRSGSFSKKRQWVVTSEDGAPVCDCPNGHQFTIAPHTALAVQVGAIIVDSFGAQWLPARLPDGSVGFSPIVVHRFTDVTEDTLECWHPLPTGDKGQEAQQHDIDQRRKSPVPAPVSVVRALSTLPTQGFLHGFRISADHDREDAAAATSFVARRGSRSVVDWNAGWQELMEVPVNWGDQGSVEAWQREVRRLKDAFCAAAAAAAKIIVEEEAAQRGKTEKLERSIPPVGDLAGEHLYMDQGILFQVANDSLGGGRVLTQAAARKVQSLEVRHASVLHSTRAPLLSAPLCCCVTHLGERVLCTALMPIGAASLAFGSTDGGRTLTSQCRGGNFPDVYMNGLEGLSQGVGLRNHLVGKSTQHPLSADTQVYAGDDGRMYVTNLARLLPPVMPVAKRASSAGAHDRASVMCRLFRPEVLSGTGRRVSADAFTDAAGGTDDEIAAQTHIGCLTTQYLRTQCVEGAAHALSELQLPETMVLQPPSVDACISCSNPFDNQFRFAAVLDKSRHLCRSCYLLLWKDALGTGDFEAVDRRLEVFALGSGSAPRKLRGLVMEPGVDELLHHFGVNLRYLGVVYCALKPDGGSIAIQHFLQCEMIARASKHLLWGRQIKAAPGGAGAVRRSVVQFLRSLLLPDGELAETFWGRELGPLLMTKFKLHMPFETDKLDRVLVFERVCALGGISCTQDAVESLLRDGRIVTDSLTCEPVVKSIQDPSPLPPEVLNDAVRRNEEQLREFWEAQLRGVQGRLQPPGVMSRILTPAD
eukprot:TRINITY_DN43929_c0_g1_i1.p1 TRINITY_DN43929_c0_g1~~TRINITY_DN43929_c0_g1_i1.p1  ORF type:complete len:871 (+),score=297.37 TRINITY_DN43929_c0_g1_i1:35-2614(+)